MSEYSIAVVGLGLIGSAALRHGAAHGTVVGIGPAEPEHWATHQGPFASHYDSGRVTRRLDARREWAVLASRAIEQYPVIEDQSGLTFHHPSGMVFVRNDADGIARQRAVAAELGLVIDVTTGAELDCGYTFPADWTCLHEPGPAGSIDPRIMIEAQHRVARAAGADIIRESAASVERHGDGFRVTTNAGTVVDAEQVVIATGAYGDEFTTESLAVAVRPEAVLLAEVDPDVAVSLAGLPSTIYLLDHSQFDDVYVVPPMRYPDGRWYVKLGASCIGAVPLADSDERHRWMTGSDADVQLGPMSEVLQALLPQVSFESFSVKPCLITDTASGLPFMGADSDGRIIARAGNGHAAKSADALGALAADLAKHGEWTDTELDEGAFRPEFGSFDPGIGSRHST